MICSVEDCGGHVLSKGYCQKHYWRNKRHGSPHVLLKAANGTLKNWIRNHLSYEADECLIWPFSRNEEGYPQGMMNPTPNRFMCELRNGPPPTPKHTAAHSCGKGHIGCIHPKHLRWATTTENHADKRLHGTQRFGATVPTSILTDDKVIEIRGLIGKMRRHHIASKFDVSESCIKSIETGRTWKHLL